MMYFGCWGLPGHYLYDRNAHQVWTSYPLRGEDLDGRFCPEDPLEREGIVQLQLIEGWTIMAFWDRSGDKRGKSNSAFIARGSHTFNQMVEQAKKEFSQVWIRFTFEVKLGGWKMNACKILLEGRFKQCCCNCKHLAEVWPHKGKELVGYACIVPAVYEREKGRFESRLRVESPWPLHSEGCEMYSPREGT